MRTYLKGGTDSTAVTSKPAYNPLISPAQASCPPFRSEVFIVFWNPQTFFPTSPLMTSVLRVFHLQWYMSWQGEADKGLRSNIVGYFFREWLQFQSRTATDPSHYHGHCFCGNSFGLFLLPRGHKAVFQISTISRRLVPHFYMRLVQSTSAWHSSAWIILLEHTWSWLDVLDSWGCWEGSWEAPFLPSLHLPPQPLFHLLTWRLTISSHDVVRCILLPSIA